MRDILFQGKLPYEDTWVVGSLILYGEDASIFATRDFPDGTGTYPVCPESVGQYTGMTEFVMTDKSIHAPLFEGDIVEVWSRRRPPCESTWNKPQSQYDIQVKARATIVFRHGKWKLDYDNNYNKDLCKLRGKEEEERTVNAGTNLYDYGYHGGNEDWHRECNSRYKWDDIVKIGNKFDTPELLSSKE